MSEQRGFLSRWALRKQQAQDGEQLAEEVNSEDAIVQHANQDDADAVAHASEPTALAADDGSDNAASPLISEGDTAEPAEEQLLGAEDLPDPDKIEVGGSFASFMGQNVDPTVRQAALRTLWKQPHYSEIDGMMEYALDYSNQEILTPEVSSELAKKVFRHLVQDDDAEIAEESESLLAEQPTATSTEAKVDDTEEVELATPAVDSDIDGETLTLAETSPLTDKLDGEITPMSQNEPVADEKNQGGVV